MKAFDCPDHGHLVPDLALGRLDGPGAEKAESARRKCAVCSSWWDEAFSDSAVAAIDAEVWDVFRAFEPPRRRRRGWLAAAAAAVLVIGGGSASLLWRDAPAPHSPPDDQVSAWDFEAGAVAGAIDSSDSSDDQAVFVGGFESGDLSEWTTGS
jgi:hypothetical protein